MSHSARRVRELAADLDVLRAERDREAAGRLAALEEVERLRAEVVRLHARVQVLEDAATVLAVPASARLRGLASLITPAPSEAHGA